MAIDAQNNKIYWTSTNLVSGPKIGRADMGDQSPEVLIDFGPASNNTPRSIGLDVAAGKMYWTNFGEGKIQRADMVVGAIPEDIITGLNGPSGIAVDADSGQIFWTVMNDGQIQSADLNGANITLLVDSLSYPNYISVNSRMNRMAWTEMGTGKVKSAALDGTGLIDYGVTALAPTGIVIEPAPDTSFTSSGELRILPSDTTVQVQSFVQFKAQLVDSNGVTFDTNADWFVKRDHVGPISEDGLLFAYFPGRANIMAKRDTMATKASLTVIDTTEDSSGINEVSIVRHFPNDKIKKPKVVKEGEMFVLAGIKHPYNILNGAAVYFPKGSLHEDITIEIKIPKFAKIKKDSVVFANRIVNGIEFNVFVDDSLIKPYHFDKPVSIAIPFKRGILKKYGIKVSNLGLFFAHDSISFDSLGVSHVMVDSSNNRIYGLVEHFSSLVIRENKFVTSIEDDGETIGTPASFILSQNYPNPFNPTTTIKYQLPIRSNVEITVFNILGQQIWERRINQQSAGQYEINVNLSNNSSGVYFYRLVAGSFMQTKKMILLK